MHALIKELYPICRSITGNGVRETLNIISRHIPLQVHEISTGTPVFDWEVPKEWNIKDAWIKGPAGNKIIDFKECNLHVLNYSVPVDKKVSLAELKNHIYTLPNFPGRIPYRTSYYNKKWGFCLKHAQFETLEEGDYQVKIDSTLEPGSLTYGELYIEGESEEEILISCHVCHPSLCNDNLSGISVVTKLAETLIKERGNRYSIRLLFIPGTIGAITWLAQNEQKLKNIRHCMVLSCVGDDGKVHWKRTRNEVAEIDRVVEKVFRESGDPYEILDFSPYGYDERQFSSPGINLPAGCFMRSPWGTFTEYHTSADNLHFVKPEFLEDSFNKILAVLRMLDQNRTYVNLNPKCEPQLGKRGLYSKAGGNSDTEIGQLAILWLLNQSDGTNSLLDIAERANRPFDSIRLAADRLEEAGLLKQVNKTEKPMI